MGFLKFSSSLFLHPILCLTCFLSFFKFRIIQNYYKSVYLLSPFHPEISPDLHPFFSLIVWIALLNPFYLSNFFFFFRVFFPMRDVSIGFQTRGPYIHSKRENKAIVLRCQLCSIVQLFWYESFLKFRSSIFVGFSSDFLIFVSVILCGNLFLTRPRQKKMTKMSSTPPSLNLIKQKFFMFFFHCQFSTNCPNASVYVGWFFFRSYKF